MSYQEYLAELEKAKRNNSALDQILNDICNDANITNEEFSLLCDQVNELHAHYDVWECDIPVLVGALPETICNTYDLPEYTNIEEIKKALKAKYGDKMPMIKENF